MPLLDCWAALLLPELRCAILAAADDELIFVKVDEGAASGCLVNEVIEVVDGTLPLSSLRLTRL